MDQLITVWYGEYWCSTSPCEHGPEYGNSYQRTRYEEWWIYGVGYVTRSITEQSGCC